MFLERKTKEKLLATKGDKIEQKQDILEMEFDDSPRRERSKRDAVKKANVNVHERERVKDTAQSNGDRSKAQTRNRGRKAVADKGAMNSGETAESESKETEQYVDMIKPGKQLKGSSRIRSKVGKKLETGTVNTNEEQGEQMESEMNSDVDIVAESKRTRAKYKTADDHTTGSDMERESTTQDETPPEEEIKTDQGKKGRRRNAVGRQESRSPADEVTDRNVKKAQGKRAIQSETSDDEPAKVSRMERHERKLHRKFQRETSNEEAIETDTDNSRGGKVDKPSDDGSREANAKSRIKGDEKEIETIDDEIDIVGDGVHTAAKNNKVDKYNPMENTSADKEAETGKTRKVEANAHSLAKARNKSHHNTANDAVAHSEPKRIAKRHVDNRKNEPEIEELSDSDEKSKGKHGPGRNQTETDEIEIEPADPEPKKHCKKKKKGKGKVNKNLIAESMQKLDFSSEDEQTEPVVHKAVVHHRATSFYEPILKEADLCSE